MRQEITHGPSFAMLRVDLSPGETIVAEAGAMVARHSPVAMEVKLNAGRKAGFFAKLWAICIAFVRKMIGGETFFVNHFSAAQGGSVWLAPALSGQIVHRSLAGQKIVLSTGAFLASMGDVDIKMRWGGLRGILAKRGAFFLEVSGTGELWFTSYGGIESIDVTDAYLVDNGHLVGWEGALQMSVTSAGGGVMGLVASGEGLVCKLTGKGRVYLQTRNLEALGQWLTPYLPG
ncbi:MAG: TIGR00266 family protein [Deltaproteobacteria bacterium]|nr:TIGR00266 family protein [Deltaproteobacteria bacterium]